MTGIAATPVPALPASDEKPRAVEAMFDRIAGRYELLNRILTFGMDARWRRATVRGLRLPPGALVLDLACGTGDLCRELTATHYRPIGVDFSAGMLGQARTAAPLVRADALRLPIPSGAADGITCGFALRNFAGLDPFFAECARVLRPQGRLAVVDVAEPRSRIVRAGHHVWFRRVVPFVGGLLSDRAAYAYLPASTVYLPATAALLARVAAAGFVEIEHRTLGGGAVQLVTGTRA
jgi:demethylmenaquinone methyltransferase/2-methoxy-6-polyprenyl-1,4-benzoquinol methylase